jgi:hypothetical protein
MKIAVTLSKEQGACHRPEICAGDRIISKKNAPKDPLSHWLSVKNREDILTPENTP